MALFHLHVTQVKRSAGQSVVTSAAYRAGEKLYSEYYGEVSDYTHKGGVVCTDILLPPQAPNQYQDRATLWNAVEKAERGKKAQLAYSFDIALQNEFSMQENIALARQFLLENFVSRGMVVDFAVHSPDKEDVGISNPHFHVMCPIRPLDEHGKWGNKQRREYVLDEHGERVLDEAGNYVFNALSFIAAVVDPAIQIFLRKLRVAQISPRLPPMLQGFRTAPIGGRHSVEYIVACLIPDALTMLVQHIFPPLLVSPLAVRLNGANRTHDMKVRIGNAAILFVWRVNGKIHYHAPAHKLL